MEQKSNKSRIETVKIIVKNLLNVVNSVYTTGADTIVSVPAVDPKTEALTFKFRDNSQVYDCKILKNKISYVESSARRSDSFYIRRNPSEEKLDSPRIIIFPKGKHYVNVVNEDGSNRSAAPIFPVEDPRLDNQNFINKPKKCKTGKPCGSTCIEKGDLCEAELSESATKTVSSITKLIAAGAFVGVIGIGTAAAVAYSNSAKNVNNSSLSNNASNSDNGSKPQRKISDYDLNNPEDLKKYAQELEKYYDPNALEDKVLKKVYQDLGYDAKPAIVSKDVINDVIANNPKSFEMYRGVADSEDSKYVNDFYYGDYYAGFGISGNGTYAAIAYDDESSDYAYKTASKYARARSAEGDNGQGNKANVIRLALKPNARIASCGQVQKEIAELFGGEKNIPSVFKDEGVAACILGYDGYSTSTTHSDFDSYTKKIQSRTNKKESFNNYFVILNRGSIYAQKDILDGRKDEKNQ